jgi:hypothetical protein
MWLSRVWVRVWVQVWVVWVLWERTLFGYFNS